MKPRETMAGEPEPQKLGQRLLPTVVDELARTDPGRVLYSVTKTANPADGFQDITAKVFARAVDRCAWLIDKSLGGPGKGKFPTLTYMGPQDIVYGIVILASIKAGYKLLLNSPRNTLEAHLALLEQTDCHTFLLPPNFPLPAVKQILAARPMRVVEIPAGIQYWTQDEPPVQAYPYTKSFADAKSEPFVLLHTSGSTGIPKPIVQTHATVSPLDAFGALPSLGLPPCMPAMCADTRVYLAFPLFHCAGVNMLLPAAIYGNFTIVLGPFPPSGEVANAVHVHGNVQHSVLIPTTLIELAQDPEHLDNLSRLTQITFGGGPCPQAVGDLISTKTRLMSCLGTTECGILPHVLCDPEDWAYMSVSPVLGHEYRHVSGDLYEQVIVRDPKLDRYQGIFATFPDKQEFPMQDLYSKHPTKENVWLYRGRTDDIVVFSNGEKLNPLDMEGMICAHPAVGAALVGGAGRFQSCLLVEAASKPPAGEEERQALIGAIWSTVEAANRQSPSHGRIHRDMVLFTTAEKPMLRAGKGTVQRKLTLELYAAELDALYEAASDADGGGAAVPQISTNGAGNNSIEDAIRQILAKSTELGNVSSLPQDANLFELGFDSLQVTVIARELNKLVASARRGSSSARHPTVKPRAVYSNPTIASLVTFVEGLVAGKSQNRSSSSRTEETPEQKMQSIYRLHASDLPISARPPASSAAGGGAVVLLTGSTGSLGSYILDSLLNDSRIEHIYCLNRGPDSLARQQASLKTKGLSSSRTLRNNNRVSCLDITDLSQPYFSLSLSEYRMLLERVAIVIHNAWQVDFNLSIESFARHVAAVRRFVDFSAGARLGPSVFFLSSVSAVANYPRIITRRVSSGKKPEEEKGVPEETFDDWRVPHDTGYGQSKLVAESLLDAVASLAGIQAAVCRIGQVAGPSSFSAKGEWPRSEWLPSLIASSKYLGKLPDSLGRMQIVDWVPVDVVAKCVVELALVHRADSTTPDEVDGASVYHIVNPQRTTWDRLAPTVARCLAQGGGARNIETVPLEAWVDALRRSASSESNDMSGRRSNPAVKILEYFEEMVDDGENAAVLLNVDKTKSLLGPLLADLGPVREKWMEYWMKQWAF
ncbi:hypothetical protein B0H66DRAFT_561211 [Apodospora peruviana]|uniref:Carrier domain-containing protein n=1 Tax=Apodospora peruviana TaxID=516989 RepID=A0AAE0I0N3_9PEZI|nr:hypothetical protein B0H66DRAFT_561211 [Apodospora peruviana]